MYQEVELDRPAGQHIEQGCCAGAKKREDLYLAFENIYPVLKQYRKGDAAPHKTRKPANPAKALAVGRKPQLINHFACLPVMCLTTFLRLQAHPGWLSWICIADGMCTEW